MHYTSFGSAKSPALLILHGWGLDGEKYHVLGKLLQDDFFVLIPDLPGFGKSEIPKHPWKLVDYAKSIRKFLQEMNINTVILLGHSFGGRIAIKFVGLEPKMVNALILTGVPGVEAFIFKRSAKRIIYQTMAKLLKPLCFLDRVKSLREKFYAKRDFGKVEGVMKQTFLNIIGEDLSSSVKNLKQPVLLLWGTRDQLVPVKDAEKLLRLIPQSQLKIFAKVGHPLPYERPHEFLREVRQFLIAHDLHA